MPNTENKISIYKQLDVHFEEIKTLVLMNSSSTIAKTINEKYGLDVSRNDIDNFLYSHKKGFDVVEYRKQHQKFDFDLARKEDAKKQFKPRFP
ncbi:hypothetical protein [Psychrobacter sp. AOP31-A1-22]|uniref:hypothetical protein n=1 Tax=Psychrobacter sp. AOP31-A1-22 TaxID=3457696 RepID=UPI0040374B91